MNKLLLSAAIMLLTLCGVQAQGIDTTIVVKNHEIKIYDNNSKIDVKVYEVRDGVRVSKEPVYESRYNSKTSDGERSMTIKVPFGSKEKDVEGNDSVSAKKSTRNHPRLRQKLPILYFNYMNISNGDFGSSSPYIEQRPVSFEWGMYKPMTIFSVGNRTVFGMATGFGFSNSYNQFDTKYVMAKNENGDMAMRTLAEHTAGQFDDASKSYLRYWSFRLPLTMQLQWKVGGEPLTVSAGAEVEWRVGMRSFAKYDGAKRTICDKVNYNPFGCNAIVQVGYAGVIIFSRMGLTDMFDSPNLGSAYQFTAGIGFNF
ncbi:MAG: hypothetical protein KBT67_11055 [bacterium]|nr:hypothetical protein [Candidatus Limimorpha caballi]